MNILPIALLLAEGEGGEPEPFFVEKFNELLHTHIPGHLILTVFLFIVAVVLVLLLRGKLSVENPSRGQQILELFVKQIQGLLNEVVGPYGRRYTVVIGSFGLFIVLGNLIGLIPGLGAPTDNINVAAALGITSFLYYVSMGFRQQGIGYLKHFFGGLTGIILLFLGPIIFLVEIISNFVRPVTLSIRLFVNMFADHKVGQTFLDLAPPLIPIFTLVLGAFVCVVQAFIFIMLSMVYLSETVPHDEHDDLHAETAHAH